MSEDEQTIVEPSREELAEGYPSLAAAITAILHDDRIGEIGVRRIEVNCFASNEVTYRVFYVGEEEPEGGYIPLGRS